MWLSSQKQSSLPFGCFTGLKKMLLHMDRNSKTMREGIEKVIRSSARDRRKNCLEFLKGEVEATITKQSFKKRLEWFVHITMLDVEHIWHYPFGVLLGFPPDGSGAEQGGSILAVEDDRYDYWVEKVQSKLREVSDGDESSEYGDESSEYEEETTDDAANESIKDKEDKACDETVTEESRNRPTNKRRQRSLPTKKISARMKRNSVKRRRVAGERTVKMRNRTASLAMLRYLQSSEPPDGIDCWDTFTDFLSCFGFKKKGSETVNKWNEEPITLASIEHFKCKIAINLSYLIGGRAYNIP